MMDDRRVNYKSKSSDQEESLCEKSMKVVVNVIRLSSFSIAQRTLGIGKGKAGNKDQYLSAGSDTDPAASASAGAGAKEAVVDQFPAAASARSRRSQQPQSRVNTKYVINGSTAYVVHKERSSSSSLLHDHEVINPKKIKKEQQQCVDGLASEYIFKIRNKLGSSAAS